jgi:HemY protein
MRLPRLPFRAVGVFVVLAAAVAAGAVFADRPGRVEIVWQDWQVDTSVGVLAGAAALLALIVALVALGAAALRRVPRDFRRRRAARRRRLGDLAVTRGIVALAAGQAVEAGRAARRAEALLGGPVPLLLAAEAAQRQGDLGAARRAYTALLDRPESEFLGLRGLIGQALDAGDDAVARPLAERARRLRPEALWLIDSLLVLEARAGDWQAARDTLAGATRSGALAPERARHHLGVVLYELSQSIERRGDARAAAGLAAKAQGLAADLAAPACHHARLLLGLSRKRAAARAIERAWRTAPHPDLARLYLEIDPEAAPLARAAALQRLAAKNPEAVESRLAIAEAALAARLWGEARRHLGLAVAAAPPPGPSRRLCLLMAQLEESEAGAAPAARQWLDRALGAPRDPCYLCARCGGESGEWAALCPQCGGFDTLLWRTSPHRRVPIIAPPADTVAPPMLPAPAMPGETPARRYLPSGLAPTAQSDN